MCQHTKCHQPFCWKSNISYAGPRVWYFIPKQSSLSSLRQIIIPHHIVSFKITWVPLPLIIYSSLLHLHLINYVDFLKHRDQGYLTDMLLGYLLPEYSGTSREKWLSIRSLESWSAILRAQTQIIDVPGGRTRRGWTGVISDQSSFLLLPVSWQAPSQPLGCPVAMATNTVYHTQIWYWNILEAQSIHFSYVSQVHFPHGFLQRFNMKHLFELKKINRKHIFSFSEIPN